MTGPSAPRRSRAALHRLVVGAGIDLVAEEGLGPGGDNLTLQRVFDRLETDQGIRVTHGSVLGRIWASQDEFRRDVLEVLAGADGTDALEETAVRMAPVLARADTATAEGRAAALSELCRVGGEASLDVLTASREWRAWTAVWALAMTGGTPDPGVGEALGRSFRTNTEAYRGIYAAIADLVGLRPRAPFTVDQIVVLATSLAEGCALRDMISSDDTRGFERPTGVDGPPVPWTLLGIGIEVLTAGFLEPDPEARVGTGSAPSADAPAPGR